MLHRSCQVNCGRFNVRVPHHLGKAVDIAPAFEHERRKRMAQHMRVEIDPGSLFKVLDEVTQSVYQQTFSSAPVFLRALWCLIKKMPPVAGASL